MERTARFTEGTKIVTKEIKYRASDGFPTKKATKVVDTRYREAIPPVQRLRKNATGFEGSRHVTSVAADSLLSSPWASRPSSAEASGRTSGAWRGGPA
jgi:hypothetical protein